MEAITIVDCIIRKMDKIHSKALNTGSSFLKHTNVVLLFQQTLKIITEKQNSVVYKRNSSMTKENKLVDKIESIY
jgi:hypothetical protein